MNALVSGSLFEGQNENAFIHERDAAPNKEHNFKDFLVTVDVTL